MTLLPDAPGRWLFRSADGREKTYWLNHIDSVLYIVGIDGWEYEKPYPPSSALSFTELVTEWGWGRWVRRVGDLPP